MIEELFKSKKIKLTKSRKKVYEVIKNSNGLITIKDIINNCNDVNNVTVYRIIDTFLQKDIIDKKIGLDNEIYYEIKPIDHSHYISCVKCHKKEKIDNDYISEFEKNISKGYKIIHHDIDFIGICDDCKK